MENGLTFRYIHKKVIEFLNSQRLKQLDSVSSALKRKTNTLKLLSLGYSIIAESPITGKFTLSFAVIRRKE